MSSADAKRLEDLSSAQCERLAYIDFRLYFFGEIGRPDLIERFGVAPAGATRDFVRISGSSGPPFRYDPASRFGIVRTPISV